MNKELKERYEAARKNVLYVLVNDFDKFDELGKYHYEINRNDFEGKLDKKLFALAKKFHEKGMKQLTSKMVKDFNIEKEDLLNTFKDVSKDAARDFSLYVEEMVAYKGMKEFDAFFEKMIEYKKRVEKEDVFEKADQFIQLVHNRIHEVTRLKKGVEGTNLLKLNKEFANIKDDGELIKTGLKAIDDVLGGWKRGGINLFSGVSNQGKTTFIIQALLYAVVVLGLKVKLINLELADADIYAKIMGLLSGEGYSAHNIASYNAAKKEDVEKHKERVDEDRKLILSLVQERFIIKTGTFTDEMLYQELRDSEKENFDIVAVDYFQLVETGAEGKQRSAKFTELQEKTRSIVRNSNYAFIWLTQLKEENEKDKDGKLKVHPMEFEIAWCKDLYKGADSELRVWRNYSNIETRTFEPHINVGFKKTRFTDRVDPIEFAFDGAVGRIGNFETPKAEEKKESEDYSKDFFDDYSDYYADVKTKEDEKEDDNLTYMDELIKEKLERDKREEESKKIVEEYYGENDFLSDEFDDVIF